MLDVRTAVFGSAAAALSFAACSGSVEIRQTQAKPDGKPDAGIDANGTDSTDANGTDSTDANGTDSTDANGTDSTDANGTDSTDANGTDSTDANGTDSTDANGTDSTDANGTDSTDANGTDSTDANGTDSTTPADKNCGAAGNPLADAGRSCVDPPTAYGNYRVTWASNASSLRSDLTVDGASNAVLLGDVSSPMTLGGTEIAPPGSDSLNTFVAKIDRLGKTQWVRVFSGAEPASVRAVPSGDVYFVANAVRNVDVGTGPLPAGSFLAKLDALGSTKWAHPLDPGASSGGFSPLAVDVNGNVAVVGTPATPPDFGAGPVSAGVVLESFSADGQPRFALGLEGLDAFGATGLTLAFGNDGRLHVASGKNGPMKIGDTAVSGDTGLLDAVVDASGGVVRARRVGSGGPIGGRVATNGSDGYLLAGPVNGTVDLGSGSSSDVGAAFAWLDGAGNVTQTKTFSTEQGAALQLGLGPAVALDPAGRVIVTGGLGGVTDLGGGLLTPIRQ